MNETKPEISRIRSFLNWGLILFITVVMVFDRYFTEAVTPLIEEEYGIDTKNTALVDGLFALAFTILAISPVFRFFGNRLSQKVIMCIGMTLWALLAFAFCFVPKQWFWLILLLRGLVDVIADFFLSCALPLIGHMFSASNRRLAIFGFQLCSFLFRLIAICIAALVANQYSWHVARLIAPCLGVLCLSLLLVFMKDPLGGNTEDEDDEPQEKCSPFSNLKPLLTWSFALIMIGSLSVDFIHEGMFEIIPDFLVRRRNETEKQWPLFLSQNYYSDFMIYSVIKCAADVLGMLLGMGFSKLLSREPHSADPWVCAVGLFAFAPLFSLFLISIKDGLVLPCVSIIHSI
ncbi:hypothetical protein XENTR_v10019644 [Xenopus tropicalis]|nr:hypothetical protein XENTR_v10019644 [Xenopus tropicalis]